MQSIGCVWRKVQDVRILLEKREREIQEDEWNGRCE